MKNKDIETVKRNMVTRIVKIQMYSNTSLSGEEGGADYFTCIYGLAGKGHINHGQQSDPTLVGHSPYRPREVKGRGSGELLRRAKSGGLPAGYCLDGYAPRGS